MDEKLIGMSLVEEVIQSVLCTSQLDRTIPLSLLIVGPSGTGKSKSIKQFTGNGIHFQNDLTTFDLNHICETDKEDLIHHLIIPDLNLPLSHKPSVGKLMIASLLGATSERIKIYVSRKDGRHEHNHRAMGLISSITPTIFWKNAQKFSELGFVRRMPPVFYTQSESTVQKILSFIEKEKVSFEQLKERQAMPTEISGEPRRVHFPEKYNRDLRKDSVLFTERLNAVIQRPRIEKNGNRKKSSESALTAISPNLYLRTLARGHALLSKNGEVKDSDMEFIGEFLTLTDSNNPRAL